MALCFYNWTAAVYQRSRAKGPAKAVLATLASHAKWRGDVEDARIVWPSVGELATESGFGKRTVERALAELERLGEIERTGRHIGRTVIWRIAIEPVVVADSAAESPAPNRQRGGFEPASVTGQTVREAGSIEHPQEHPQEHPPAARMPAGWDDRGVAEIAVKQFLRLHEYYWPELGEMRAVRMPVLSLRAEAEDWLRRGADLDLLYDVWDRGMARMAAKNRAAPRSMQAFHLSLADAIARRDAEYGYGG
jgi:DNA-binding transcriptional MocR family regulator